jgi:hypothetical protein
MLALRMTARTLLQSAHFVHLLSFVPIMFRMTARTLLKLAHRRSSLQTSAFPSVA